MFKFIHAADLHLDSPLRGLDRYDGAPTTEVRRATRRALENLVNLAKDQAVAFVLIAGDLYDGDWQDFDTGLFFVQQMVKLRDADIPVYLVAGNHDAANRMTRRLPLPENVHLFDHQAAQTAELENLGVAIHGQSYPRAAVQDNLACAYPKAVSGAFNIGLIHTSLTGREGHEPYAPCTLEDLRAKQYHYWALGHVHQREKVCDSPPVIFPGNTQGRHMRETGPKGCVLASVDDRQKVVLERHWLDVFRWERCRVRAAGLQNADDVLDAVRRELGEALKRADGRALGVRVEIEGACSAHRALAAEPLRSTSEIRALAQDVGSGELWIEKVELRTSLPADCQSALTSDGPLGELLHYLAELKADSAQMISLVQSVADLRDRLPAELVEGSGAMRFDDPAELRGLVDHVEQLLVQQLLARGGSP